MSKIKYADGTVINFNGNPTQADVEEAYAIAKSKQNTQPIDPIKQAEDAISKKQDTGFFAGIAGNIVKPFDNIANTLSTYGGAVFATGLGNVIGDNNKTYADYVNNSKKIIQDNNMGVSGILDPNQKSSIRDITTGAGAQQLAGDSISALANFIPVGKGAATLGQLAKAGAKVGGTTALGNAVTEDKSLADTAKDVAAGTGVGTLAGVGGQFAINTLKTLTKGTLGVITGAGTQAIDNILSNPKAALEGLSVDGIIGLRKSADLVNKSINNYYVKAQNTFENTLNSIKDKVKTVDSNLINDKVTNIFYENNIGVKLDGKLSEIDLSGFEGANKALLNKTFDLIKGKPLKSIDDVEEVAQKINRQRLNTSDQAMQGLLGRLSAAVREGYTEQLINMGYKKEAQIAQNYAKAMDKIDVWDNMFGTDAKSRIVKESNIISTIEKLKNLTKGDKVTQTEGLENLGIKSEILARESGREMQGQVSRANAAIGDTISNVIQAAIPSKIVGKIVAGAKLKQEELAAVASTAFTSLPKELQNILPPVWDSLNSAKRNQLIQAVTKIIADN